MKPLVLKRHGKWWIRIDGTHYGGYRDLRDAFRAAEELASAPDASEPTS